LHIRKILVEKELKISTFSTQFLYYFNRKTIVEKVEIFNFFSTTLGFDRFSVNCT